MKQNSYNVSDSDGYQHTVEADECRFEDGALVFYNHSNNPTIEPTLVKAFNEWKEVTHLTTYEKD